MEQNKQQTARLFARLTAGDVEGALSLLADDASWEIAGNPASLPSAGSHDKPRLRRLFTGMLESLRDGLEMQVVRMIAEGDAVAAEVRSQGALKNGSVYRQAYHFALTFRDGKIVAVREYLDTQHAFEIWFRR